MSVAEIKEELKRLNLAERAELERYLRALRWTEDPEMPGRLEQAHASFERGGKVTADELDARIAARRAGST